MTSIGKFFSDRPWLFVIGGIGLFTSLTLTFVVIACLNPPEML